MQEIIVHMQNTFFMHHLYMCRYPKIYVFNKSIHKKSIKKKLKTHVEFIVHLSIIHYLPQQCGYHFAIQQKKILMISFWGIMVFSKNSMRYFEIY